MHYPTLQEVPCKANCKVVWFSGSVTSEEPVFSVLPFPSGHNSSSGEVFLWVREASALPHTPAAQQLLAGEAAEAAFPWSLVSY